MQDQLSQLVSQVNLNTQQIWQIQNHISNSQLNRSQLKNQLQFDIPDQVSPGIQYTSDSRGQQPNIQTQDVELTLSQIQPMHRQHVPQGQPLAVRQPPGQVVYPIAPSGMFPDPYQEIAYLKNQLIELNFYRSRYEELQRACLEEQRVTNLIMQENSNLKGLIGTVGRIPSHPCGQQDPDGSTVQPQNRAGAPQQAPSTTHVHAEIQTESHQDASELCRLQDRCSNLEEQCRKSHEETQRALEEKKALQEHVSVLNADIERYKQQICAKDAKIAELAQSAQETKETIKDTIIAEMTEKQQQIQHLEEIQRLLAGSQGTAVAPDSTYAGTARAILPQDVQKIRTEIKRHYDALFQTKEEQMRLLERQFYEVQERILEKNLEHVIYGAQSVDSGVGYEKQHSRADPLLEQAGPQPPAQDSDAMEQHKQ